MAGKEPWRAHLLIALGILSLLTSARFAFLAFRK